MYEMSFDKLHCHPTTKILGGASNPSHAIMASNSLKKYLIYTTDGGRLLLLHLKHKLDHFETPCLVRENFVLSNEYHTYAAQLMGIMLLPYTAHDAFDIQYM